MELRQLEHHVWMLENAKNTLKTLKFKLKKSRNKLEKELLLKEIDLHQWIIKNSMNGIKLWHKKK